MVIDPNDKDEWYTPRDVFKAMDCVFDLDPCSPGVNHWVPSRRVYTKEDDGLTRDWEGFVFMNPPFGGRNEILPWLQAFVTHGNGIGVCFARMSAGWMHKYRPFDYYFHFNKKMQFVRPDGRTGTQPKDAVMFFGVGQKAYKILSRLEEGGHGFLNINHRLLIAS